MYGKSPLMSLMVFLCFPFSHEMSWMRSGTKLCQFLKISYRLCHCIYLRTELVQTTTNKTPFKKIRKNHIITFLLDGEITTQSSI